MCPRYKTICKRDIIKPRRLLSPFCCVTLLVLLRLRQSLLRSITIDLSKKNRDVDVDSMSHGHVDRQFPDQCQLMYCMLLRQPACGNCCDAMRRAPHIKNKSYTAVTDQTREAREDRITRRQSPPGWPASGAEGNREE